MVSGRRTGETKRKREAAAAKAKPQLLCDVIGAAGQWQVVFTPGGARCVVHSAGHRMQRRAECEGRRLSLRCVRIAGQCLLFLEGRQTTLQTTLLKPLRLTQREAEVLAWASQGKSNKEVGSILGLSARTVGKHLEHIYSKLGVESRTAAAARAFEIVESAAN
ncbi:MAG: helix-turn-helix transcriptional regulator [Deltaproteobacteria bacterium]|nr:helix-turn-helix transcriptional regulator [Deltaproteobacteria bacterium]